MQGACGDAVPSFRCVSDVFVVVCESKKYLVSVVIRVVEDVDIATVIVAHMKHGCVVAAFIVSHMVMGCISCTAWGPADAFQWANIQPFPCLSRRRGRRIAFNLVLLPAKG